MQYFTHAAKMAVTTIVTISYERYIYRIIVKNSDINNNVLGKICGDLNTVNSAGKLNPPKANMSIFVTSLFICPGGNREWQHNKKML